MDGWKWKEVSPAFEGDSGEDILNRYSVIFLTGVHLLHHEKDQKR